MSIAGNQFFTGIVNQPTTVPDLSVNRLITGQTTSGATVVSSLTASGLVTAQNGLTVSAGNVVVTNGKLATSVTATTLSGTSTGIPVTSNVMSLGAASVITIGTISGGLSGQIITLIFTDANIMITDTSGTGPNTINLSAAFTSAANTVLTLVYNGNKWFEVSRSVNL